MVVTSVSCISVPLRVSGLGVLLIMVHAKSWNGCLLPSVEANSACCWLCSS
jgi:hypothetical protein